jgi:hypothetical protein
MLTETEKDRLYSYLVAADWTFNDGRWVAPHGSLRIAGDEPWQGDLMDFLRCMRDRLANLMNVQRDDDSVMTCVQDTASLVRALSDIAAPHSSQSGFAQPEFGQPGFGQLRCA